MKELILQIAGVKSEAEFYKKFPTQEAFFKAYPEANEIIANYQNNMANEMDTEVEEKEVEKMGSGGNVPTNPSLWSRAKAAAKAKYDVYPSAYANGFAAKWYKEKGGKWKKAAMGGYVDEYAEGGGIDNPGFKALPKDVQENIISNMSMGGEVEEYKNGGYTVRRSNDRKGKTHVVIGPDGTKKYFGDPKMGERGKSKHGKDAFYARHRTNLKNNPYFRAYARATWADGGILPDVEQLMLAGQGVYEMGGMVEYPTKYFLGGILGGNAPQGKPQGYVEDFNYMQNYPGGGMIAGPMMGYEDDFMYAMGGGINIKPENKGKFTEWAKRNGMTVSEAANKVMANTEDYSSRVVKMANFAKNTAKWKKEMGGFLYQDDGEMNVNIGNNVPVQTETYQGQPEQVVLPDGTIESVDAKTAHENMADNTITDVLPTGSHIQSSRNKLTPAQYQQLIDMFTPEVAKERMKQIEEISKGKNKKISPAEISEYAKNKYQTKSTPNSFDTDKLKEGNKKSYVDLSIQMNDLIKAGKELAEGILPQEMMAYGGMVNKYAVGGPVDYSILSQLLNPETLDLNEFSKKDTKTGKYRLNMPTDLSLEKKLGIEKAAERYGLKNLIQGYTPGTGNRFSAGLTGEDFEKKLALTTLGEEEYNKIKDNPNAIRETAYKAIDFKPTGKIDYNNPEFYNQFKKAFENKIPESMRPAFGSTGPMGLDYWNAIAPKAKATPTVVAKTPAQKAEDVVLGDVTPVQGARQIPMQNRFNYGLLEGQLNRGLGANEAYVNALMGLSPVYTMETPDTYIRSMKTEVPVGNILYNIEKAQRNSANALADQTGDWSTLAGNIANAGANAYNQIGDTLSALNEKNIGLYNQQQALQQGLLEGNMDVRNQNLTNMQNMLNYKRNLLGKKSVRDAELFAEYAKSMGESSQKEQNQKLTLTNIMAANPDMFKGEKGQMFANQILGNTGSFNNPFAGSLLGFI
jgi:hypothetical protein